jgi:hypothetical protein
MIALRILPVSPLLADISFAQGLVLIAVFTAIGWLVYWLAALAAGSQRPGGSQMYFRVFRILLVITPALWVLASATNAEVLVTPAVFLFVASSATAYFIPTAIAAARRHPNLAGLFAVNLFLGWTFLGFVGAVVWALQSPNAGPAPVPHEGIEERLQTLSQLKASGLISEKEFEEKRSAVLDSLVLS